MHNTCSSCTSASTRIIRLARVNLVYQTGECVSVECGYFIIYDSMSNDINAEAELVSLVGAVPTRQDARRVINTVTHFSQ